MQTKGLDHSVQSSLRCVLIATFYKALIFFGVVGIAVASAIPISGYSTFSYDPDIAFFTWNISFSGANGTSSVSAPDISCEGTESGCFNREFSPVGVAIDGIYFSPGLFTFCGIPGSITGLSAEYQPVVTESVIGYESMTAETCASEGAASSPAKERSR
jgi:hypothetical protein